MIFRGLFFEHNEDIGQKDHFRMGTNYENQGPMGKRYNKEPIHISNILDDFLTKHQSRTDTGMTRIWDLWESAIEGPIAENAHPAAFKGKLLLVHVSSSVWIQQLQFLKVEIMNKINEAAGKELVGEIRFKIGPV